MKKKKNSNKKKNNNVVALTTKAKKLSIIKMKSLLLLIILLLVALLVRIGWLQFIEGSFLKEQAYSQQTINQIISPKRGNIYDSTGKTLANLGYTEITDTSNPNYGKTPL